MGRESAAGVRRRRARDIKEIEASEKSTPTPTKELSTSAVDVIPR